jgi:hypothetical protein
MEHRFDQLAYHSEPELPLGAARSQHPETFGLGHIPAGRQQDRFADARRPLHHQRPSVALLGPLEAPSDLLQLSIALKQ